MQEPDAIRSSEDAYSYAQDFDLIHDVAREAGARAMEWLRKGAEAWEKAPNDPVTEADLDVNELIYKRLLDARPEYGWISEESAASVQRRDRKKIFVVDPIDGTRAFIKHEPCFAVCIALLEDNQPVIGVVYNPATEELFEAITGRGATLNGEPIRAGCKDDLHGARFISRVSKHKRATVWPGAEFVDPVPNSVAYRICLAAADMCDAAIAMPPKTDWDLAAAALILKEAGGLCTDHLGQEIVYNHPKFYKRSVVAAGASLHGLLIDRLRELSVSGTATEGAKGARDAEASAEPSNRVKTPLLRTQARPMSNDTPKAQEQLLHIVFGGELKDVSGTVFEDLSKVDFVGAFESYTDAYDAWKSAAQRTVDNAHMRYFILHAHRLLDPETGRTLDV